MEPEECQKWYFPPYISFRGNGHPGIAAGDDNCILITELMVSVLQPDGRPFLESPTHHLCQFFFLNLMLVNKTRQETKVMRLCSDPMDFIPYSVA